MLKFGLANNNNKKRNNMQSFINDTIYAKDPKTGNLAVYILVKIIEEDNKERFIVRDSAGVESVVDDIYLDDSLNYVKVGINDNANHTAIFEKAAEKIITNRKNGLPILVGAFEAMEIIRESLDTQYINTDVELNFIDYLENNNILKIIWCLK